MNVGSKALPRILQAKQGQRNFPEANKINIFGKEMSLLKTLTILLLFYFVAGTMFLPEGDFSTLPDMPKMYAHCKAVEDPDMDLPDFITEHLLQIDGLFGHDIPEPGDKPHQPIQFHHQLVQIITAARQFNIELIQPVVIKSQLTVQVDQVFLSGYTGFVFRPPMG
jgi:hypothetical protein